MKDRHPQMTHSELAAITTPTVDLGTGNRAFGLGRSLGYRLAREGSYPCRLIKAGTAYRVVTADLRNKLGAPESDEQAA